VVKNEFTSSKTAVNQISKVTGEKRQAIFQTGVGEIRYAKMISLFTEMWKFGCN